MTLSYAEAVERIATLQSADDAPEFSPACRTQLITHGDRAERAVVFFHGYSNCPRQFHELGALFHERGYNVFIPRVPGHGLSDRMTTALNDLRSDQLLDLTDQSVSLARGLGERVTVAGLSMGGVMAAWAAQNRSDVDCAAIIAPVLNLPPLPPLVTRLAVRAAKRLPGFLWWKDPRFGANWPGPKHAYPRMASRGLAAIISIGIELERQAARSAPAARDIVVITNAHDRAVDNLAARRLAGLWRSRGGQVREYEFEASHQLPHDLIDPGQPAQQTALVYPVLWEQIASPDTKLHEGNLKSRM